MTQVASVLFFDGAIGSHELDPWKRPLWTETRSSYDSKLPIVLQRAFLFPARIAVRLRPHCPSITLLFFLTDAGNHTHWSRNYAKISSHWNGKWTDTQTLYERIGSPTARWTSNAHSAKVRRSFFLQLLINFDFFVAGECSHTPQFFHSLPIRPHLSHTMRPSRVLKESKLVP